MTTCLYSRITKEIGADTQNTTPDQAIVRVHKLELLKNGWYFMGSGHNFTIGQCRAWAATSWDAKSTPDWTTFLEDRDEYGFACIVINPINWDVYMIDNEMIPFKMLDDVGGVGSGAAYGIGALLHGSTILEALEIAASRDPSTSAPFEVTKIG